MFDRFYSRYTSLPTQTQDSKCATIASVSIQSFVVASAVVIDVSFVNVDY
jgi:hypothetical protein